MARDVTVDVQLCSPAILLKLLSVSNASRLAVPFPSSDKSAPPVRARIRISVICEKCRRCNVDDVIFLQFFFFFMQHLLPVDTKNRRLRRPRIFVNNIVIMGVLILNVDWVAPPKKKWIRHYLLGTKLLIYRVRVLLRRRLIFLLHFRCILLTFWFFVFPFRRAIVE